MLLGTASNEGRHVDHVHVTIMFVYGIDANALAVWRPARVEIAAVFLGQFWISVEATQIMPLSSFHIEEEQDALVRRAIGICVAEQPARVHRRERHVAILGQNAVADHVDPAAIPILVKMVVNLAGMGPPHNNLSVLSPERMRDLPLRLLIVKGTHARGVEVGRQLGQRVIRALQQSHVGSVGRHRDQSMQEARLIFHALSPAVKEEHPVGRRIHFNVANPVDRLLHRVDRMERCELRVAHGQLRCPGAQIHVPDSVVTGAQRQIRLHAIAGIPDRLVRNIEATIVNAQRPDAIRRHDVHRHRQDTGFPRPNIDNLRGEVGIAGLAVIGAHIEDDARCTMACIAKPLQLGAHLPVPRGGMPHAMEYAVVLRHIEVADISDEVGCQVVVAPGHFLAKQVLASRVPVGLVVVAEEMVLAIPSYSLAREFLIFAHTRSTIRLPAVSREATASAGITRVDEASSTMAGPSTRSTSAASGTD
ncbi:hypothetical protein CBM2598_U10279 [Cupriavidus taiwanensis]|nr:hypothetical protein CBM2598_U10279 [Cupriavidus taiwanensis]